MILPSFAMASTLNNKWHNPYADVNESLWGYQYIKELNIKRILPSETSFKPNQQEDRGRFVSCIYAMYLKNGGKRQRFEDVIFEDVPADHPYFEAICWAKTNGIINGVGGSRFAPDASLTRENICTILLRYAEFASLSIEAKKEAKQFVDSLHISKYARTPVVACQIAGIIKGYKDGWFRPLNTITRQESAAMIWRFMDQTLVRPSASVEVIKTEPGAYDALYNGFKPVPDPTVLSGPAVDLSYFDKVAIVGDSVSVMLQYYCAASKALGNATFLCAGSLSATNALYGVGSSSVHPFYQGKKVLVEDGVAACGAEVVYIMLGINNLSGGVDFASGDMLKLIDRILQKSPNVKIVIESVTPMSASSTIISNSLNNERIRAYNQRMKDVCQNRGWYYMNVAEIFTDSNGYLPAEYCSDNNGMGIHFTSAAAEKWAEYLITHVPDGLA